MTTLTDQEYDSMLAEIEGLRIERAALQHAIAYSEEDSISYELGKLKELCGRAADALEKYTSSYSEEFLAIVEELRQAASI
jgi:hypothetical protein